MGPETLPISEGKGNPIRLPSQKKVLREDLKEAAKGLEPLIDVINSFMEAVYQALNRNLTLDQNIACFVKEITYQTPSTYPLGVDVVEFTSELRAKAIGLTVLQVVDKATYTPPAGPVYAPWVENNGSIQVSTITGLAASKAYTVRLLVY